MIITDVDADCNITYSDGSVKPCEHRPHYTFVECDLEYGPGGHCPKYDHHHLMEKRRIEL